MGADLTHLVQQAQHRTQPKVLESDIGRKAFGFGREDLDGGASYYEGEFKLFLRSGNGTLENTETGQKYVGEFLADKCHGKGKQVWPDGSQYDGQWCKGRKHGQGIYISPTNLKYEGAWEDGRRHGKGIQEYANGDKYDGWWYNGQCSGLGIYFFADGSQYQGAWNHGKYDGAGILYAANGDRERLTYFEGRLMKREVLPPGQPPAVQNKSRPGIFCEVLISQDRIGCLQPTVLTETSGEGQLLIKRDCNSYDLSAPPLRMPRRRELKELPDELRGDSIETVTGGDTLGTLSALTGGPSTDDSTFITEP